MFWNWSDGGGQRFSKCSENQKVPNYPRGGGGNLNWEKFPNFPIFFFDGFPKTHSQLKWYIRLLYLKKIINIFLKLLKYLDSIGTAQYIQVFNKKLIIGPLRHFSMKTSAYKQEKVWNFMEIYVQFFWMGIKMQHFYIG